MNTNTGTGTGVCVGVVVIAHQQSEALPKVLSALQTQLGSRDRLCVVIATEADTETYAAATKALTAFNVTPTSLQFAQHGITGFNAGANRDQGTCYLLGSDPELSGIVYIDGDCVPTPTTIAGFRNLFHTAGSIPVLGNGLRKHSTTGTVDSRINSLAKGNDIFTIGVDRVALHDRDIRGHRVCWSCLCGLNVAAIRLARSINHALFQDSNRVFASTWDGRYGAEDTFLGLSVFRGGGVVVACDPLVVCCEHQDHTTKYDTQAAVPNTRLCPEADANLISYLQCTSACYVTLHTRVYSRLAVNANKQLHDSSEFYDNILSVDSAGSDTNARATLSVLGFDDTTLPHQKLIVALASYMIGRVVTYTYGSGTTHADSLKSSGDPTKMTEYATSVWRSIRRKVVSVTEYIEAYKSAQQMQRQQMQRSTSTSNGKDAK